MFRRTLKLAWFKRNRYALTIVAIGLSVAFITSTLLLTTSIADVGAPITDAYEDVDTVITAPELVEADGPQAAVATPVPATVVTDLQDAGYEAVGFSSPYAQVLGADGDPSGQAQASANVAEPWLGDSALNGFTITDGRAPDGLGEMALDVTTADRAGLEVGDSVSYVTDAGLQQAELVGVALFGGADNDPYVSTMLLDPADDLFTVGQGYDYILVADDGAADPVTAEVSQLIAGTGDELTVQTGTAWVTDQIDEINSALGFFETFLTVFAVIAVVVGLVIVTNTFTVSLAQRTEELALLRLVGTTRRQLMSQVVIEALLLGVAGTAIGLVGGLAGVNVMGWFLDVLGLTIERSDAIAPVAIIIGAVVGIGVTVGAAVWPARKATTVAPIEALRSAELEPPSAGRRRTGSAIALGVAGAAALAYGMIQGDIWSTSFGIGGLFFALYLAGELLIKLVARIARPALAMAGPTGTIASRNLERGAGRTSAAASALMIGVGLIAFFTLMAATIGQFVGGEAADSIEANYVVQGVGSPPGAVLGDEVIADLANTDGVDTIVPISQTVVLPAGGVEMPDQAGPGGGFVVAMADVGDLETVYDFDVTAGSLDAVSGTAVVLNQDTADALELTAGDSLAVTGQAGLAELDIAAVVATSLPGVPNPAIIGAPDLAAPLGYDGPATTAYLSATADEATLTEAIGVPTIDVLTTDDYVDSLTAGLDTILALVYALLAVAVIIALVGIANTVSLAISERVGEIAAVRAAGASMRQIFWSLISEFSLLAFVGVASGLGLAWVSATGFFQALSDGQVTYPETDLTAGLIIAVAGVIGGSLAAWLPARSASRSDLLDVLRAE
ncbi:MAG: FtsX-like permease family protein [Actinomycetota bacterium]